MRLKRNVVRPLRADADRASVDAAGLRMEIV